MTRTLPRWADLVSIDISIEKLLSVKLLFVVGVFELGIDKDNNSLLEAVASPSFETAGKESS